MLKFPLCLALCLVAGTAMAIAPVPFHAGSGPPNVVGSGRDVCWSEPADLNGLIASSEQILAFGLESEIANDFVPTSSGISHVAFWGGYWNNSTPCVSGIATPGFNLKFYDDAGCIPGSNIAWIVATTFTETSVGCQQGVFPMFKWDIDVNVALTGGNLYWFGGQLKDHAFPPQGGRLAAGVVTGCDSMFLSAYFGYPDWTPAVDVFLQPYDASQEFICGVGTTGACCFSDGHCTVGSAAECSQAGGAYMGDGTNCDPNYCIAAGACCWPDGHCTWGSGAGCDYGDYQGDGTTCEPNPCHPYTVGACCVGDGSYCVLMTHDACDAFGGQYLGDDTSCNPNPCPPTPTKRTTWGAIKGGYR